MAWCRTAAIAAAALALAGCAGTPKSHTRPMSADERAELEMPLECDGPTACSVMWRRTQFWIAENASTRLQTVTDVVIETYNGGSFIPGWNFRATREPIGGARERIQLLARCSSASWCPLSADIMDAQFRRYVRSAR